MTHTIRDIAQAIGAEAAGDLDLKVSGASEPALAAPDQLALAMDPKYAPGLAKGQARAAMLWPGADWQAMGLRAAIFAPRGRLAMAGLSVWPEDRVAKAQGFGSWAAEFGYRGPEEAVLAAFRLRFRPWGRGPVSAVDAGLMQDLAARFPAVL